jgi:hypothetical protein
LRRHFDFPAVLCEHFQTLNERLGPIPAALLTPEQRAAAQAVIDGPRGAQSAATPSTAAPLPDCGMC